MHLILQDEVSTPRESGHFDGQRGYGYISIEKYVDAARTVNTGRSNPSDYDQHGLSIIANTVILNAGRISLDQKRPNRLASGKTASNGFWNTSSRVY